MPWAPGIWRQYYGYTWYMVLTNQLDRPSLYLGIQPIFSESGRCTSILSLISHLFVHLIKSVALYRQVGTNLVNSDKLLYYSVMWVKLGTPRSVS